MDYSGVTTDYPQGYSQIVGITPEPDTGCCGYDLRCAVVAWGDVASMVKFRQLKMVLRSFIYARIDELSSWWSYRVAQAERHLEHKKLSKNPPPKDEEEAFNRFDYLSQFEADVNYHETRHIERLCIRYGVPIPSRLDSDLYQPFYDSGMWVLTEEGKDHLSKEIRAAKKERLESFRSWVLAASGLIGVIIALISII